MTLGRQVPVAGVKVPGERSVSLLSGERVSATWTANRIRDGRAYEGYLYVTSQRLVHVPWPASAFRGAEPFGMPLAEVAGADMSSRGSSGVMVRGAGDCGSPSHRGTPNCSWCGVSARRSNLWSGRSARRVLAEGGRAQAPRCNIAPLTSSSRARTRCGA